MGRYLPELLDLQTVYPFLQGIPARHNIRLWK